MSTTIKQWTLKLLHVMKIKYFKPHSKFNIPFLCYPGDFATEHCYYNQMSNIIEVAVMVSWCRQFEKPTVIDIGANTGFISTQIAQLVRDVTIFCFEPVVCTFVRLVESIEILKLEKNIFPICCAISDHNAIVKLCYSQKNTLFSQIVNDINLRIGEDICCSASLKLKHVLNSIHSQVCLIKIDVEGHEANILSELNDLPINAGIMLEWNPQTLNEQNNYHAMLSLLKKYELFYINDFEGQRLELGVPVFGIETIDWVCNVFAILSQENREKFIKTVEETHKLLSLV